jgi:hypothetical protein
LHPLHLQGLQEQFWHEPVVQPLHLHSHFICSFLSIKLEKEYSSFNLRGFLAKSFASSRDMPLAIFLVLGVQSPVFLQRTTAPNNFLCFSDLAGIYPPAIFTNQTNIFLNICGCSGATDG